MIDDPEAGCNDFSRNIALGHTHMSTFVSSPLKNIHDGAVLLVGDDPRDGSEPAAGFECHANETSMNTVSVASLARSLSGVNNLTRIRNGMETLGGVIKRLRLERGWTQEYVAEQVGMSQRWLSNLETDGVKMPRIQSLRRLAAVLGIDPGVLVQAAQYSDSLEAGKLVADSVDDEPLPAHLRTSFLKLEKMTPERRRRVIQFIDDQDALDQADRERLRRDQEGS